MSATVKIYQYTGSGTETEAPTEINFLSVDEAGASVALNPITRPTDGNTAYSFEIYLRLKVTDLGGSTSLSAFKFWVTQDLPTNSDALMTSAKTSAYSAPTFAAPVQTVSAQAVNATPTSEPGGANLGVGGSLAGTITAVNGTTDYLVLQQHLSFDSMTPAPSTLHFKWTES